MFRKSHEIKGIADPITSVVVTTIINAVVTITSQCGKLTFSFSTSANAIDPRTIPDKNKKLSSQKFNGIYIHSNNFPR